MNYYSLSAKKTIEKLNSSEKTGLNSSEVENRIKKYGKNLLPQEKPFTIYKIIINQVLDPLIMILIASAILTYFVGHLQDLYIILAIIIIEFVIGFIEEYRSDKIVSALAQISETRVKILREGNWQQCFSEDIVLGDIIRVDNGDKIPADARIIKTEFMTTNESILTGESEPKEKRAVIIDVNSPVNERNNMLFQGTYVSSGSGVAIVTSIGAETEFGKISTKTISIKRNKTPLQKKITSFTKIISLVVLIIAIVFIITGLILEKSLYDLIILAISISVSAIPESFPIIISICLVTTIAKLARKKVIVKHLPAAETLGSTSIICLDKTGTLTENKLAVKKIMLADKNIFSIDQTDYSPEGNYFLDNKTVKPINYPQLELLLLAGTVCNDSRIKKNHKGEWVAIGDPTESALIAAAAKANMDPDKLIDDCPREQTMPFVSGQNFMATLNSCPLSKKRYIFLKGSPENIIEKCSYQNIAGKTVKLNVKDKKDILDSADDLAQKSYRMLAIAYKEVANTGELELNETNLKYGIVFLGLVAMIDPIRPTAQPSFKLASEAGLKIIIITGDHPYTAVNIAKSLGIKIEEENIITGETLAKISQEEFEKIASNILIFARTLPEQKMMIIDYWQKNGRVVAMTGDGVNDAPALKKADIGIAMGNGTDVAKEAAEIILLENDFSRIVDAIKYGRLLYDNIKKSVLYLLGHNIGEIGIIFLALILRIPLPLLPTQILWTNLVTDGLIDEALIFEKPEKDIMERPPRPQTEKFITSIMWRRIATIGISITIISFFTYNFFLSRTDLQYARTVIFALTSFFSIFGVYACRSLSQSQFSFNLFGNKFLNYVTIFTSLVQILVLYVPFFRNIFSLSQLKYQDFILIICLGLSLFVIIEIEKYLENKISFSNKKLA